MTSSGKKEHKWARLIAKNAVKRPGLTLLAASLLTISSIFLMRDIGMSTDWKSFMPANDPVVAGYDEIQKRFTEANIIVAIEGNRDDIVEFAKVISPQMKAMPELRYVQAESPTEFLRDHAFSIADSSMFVRMIDMYKDRSLVGAFKGMNDDFEKEYSSDEDNLKSDEVQVSQGLLGMMRSLEILIANMEGSDAAGTGAEAADIFLFGDPWALSLDREMLIISAGTVAKMEDWDEMIVTAEKVDQLIESLAPGYPDVAVAQTGFATIQAEEMNAIGSTTKILSLLALILIYLLLARSFRGWVMPLIAIAPLIAGILWTIALLSVLYGLLNMFTMMIGLILLGLGIDFSIHIISRFREEVGVGTEVEDAITITLSGAGVGVISGALTTAAAFLMLLTGDMGGIREFGMATGSGVLLTVLAVFTITPPMLVLRRRAAGRKLQRLIKRQENKATKAGGPAPDINTVDPSLHEGGIDWLGKVALAGWNRPGLWLAGVVLILGIAGWGWSKVEYQFDLLEMDPQDWRSIQLEREIPERYGMAKHAAWVICETVDESRDLKDRFEDQAMVGAVVSISDYLSDESLLAYKTPILEEFRKNILRQQLPEWNAGDDALLKVEIDRLWDNLDAMSNLAFVGGMDRVVRVIDRMTGFNADTEETNPNAVLPKLSALLEAGVDENHAAKVANDWGERMTGNIYSMADPAPVTIEMIPEFAKRTHLPDDGKEGYLLNILPRRTLWGWEDLILFEEQTRAITEKVTGTEQLFLVMMDYTKRDGKRASLLALAVIMVLLFVHFRGPQGWLALIPLASGAILMLGLMFLLGIKYNYMTMITVPIILGIGIDDGIHALHRFREEVGKGTFRVYNGFRHVGKAIMLTSLTTMIGFGSVALYELPSMADFGMVLFLGVGCCFLTTIFILPALLRLFNRKEEETLTAKTATEGV